MIRAGGDRLQAEQLADCSFMEYYWRIERHNAYVERVKREQEDAERRAKAKR